MKKLLHCFMFFALVLSGCSSFYTANSLNVPLLKKYNESSINSNVGLNGLDIQGATAVDHHLSIMGNISMSTSGKDSLKGRHHQHLMAEVALGHFGYLTKKTVYEVYVGYGRGYLQSYNQLDFIGNYNTLTRGQFNRYFIQGNFGKKVDALEFGGAIKTSFLNVFEIKAQEKTFQQAINSVFVEPAVIARYDWNQFKLTGQLGYSHDLTGNFNLSHQHLIFNLGIMYKLKKNYY